MTSFIDLNNNSILVPVVINPQSDGSETYTYPFGTDTVLSIQPDGTISTRPKGQNGTYEKFYRNGNLTVVHPIENKAYWYPFFANVP